MPEEEEEEEEEEEQDGELRFSCSFILLTRKYIIALNGVKFKKKKDSSASCIIVDALLTVASKTSESSKFHMFIEYTIDDGYIQ